MVAFGYRPSELCAMWAGVINYIMSIYMSVPTRDLRTGIYRKGKNMLDKDVKKGFN